MGHTEVDGVAFVTHRTTPRETVIEFAICGRICIEHESGALERPAIIPPRVRCAPLPELAAPSVPDAAAITRAAVEAVARAERSVLPTVRPGLVKERIISARSYCETIALAFLASPDGSDDEEALDAALTAACDRAGLSTDEVLQAMCDEHGALHVEGADDDTRAS